MKKSSIALLICFILFLVFAFFSSKCQRERYFDDNEKFDKAEINGKVYKARLGQKTSSFLLEDDSLYFFFDDWIISNTEKTRFYKIAEKGDSVYKASLADTLFLYKKDGRMMMFTFDRFWNKE